MYLGFNDTNQNVLSTFYNNVVQEEKQPFNCNDCRFSCKGHYLIRYIESVHDGKKPLLHASFFHNQSLNGHVELLQSHCLKWHIKSVHDGKKSFNVTFGIQVSPQKCVNWHVKSTHERKKCIFCLKIYIWAAILSSSLRKEAIYLSLL